MAKAKDETTKPTKMYEIRLKPGHPTGVYHRAGIEFSISSPTFLEKVPDAVMKDFWLIVSECECQTES